MHMCPIESRMQLKVLEQLTVLGLSSQHWSTVVVGLLSVFKLIDRLAILDYTIVSSRIHCPLCKHVLSRSLTEPTCELPFVSVHAT
jgi:hypothetical protein